MSAWVVVPKTPRLVMLLNARECNNDDAANAHVYRRMIAARPQSPDVPVLLVQRTEAEWREEFEKWADPNVGRVENAIKYSAWLAALRLVGAIKDGGT